MLRKFALHLTAALAIWCLPGLAMAQDVIELPGIVVTASPLESLEDETFATVTVLEEEELKKGLSRSLGDALFTKPGITSSTFAPGSSRPIIRGLDNFRVGIMENGIGSHDVSALSEDHGVPIDPLATQKVEVIRGPATLRYGSQAIGGVVNAANNRIPTDIPNGKYNYLELDSGYSSVDKGGEGSVQFGAGAGNFAIHADMFKRRGKDYDTPDGVQEGTSFDSRGGAVGASLVFDKGFIGVSWSRFDSLYYIPGEEAAEDELHIDMKQTKINSKGEYRPGSGFVSKVKYWFGYTDYKHDEIGKGHDHGHHDGEEEEEEEEHHDEEDELTIGSTFLKKQYEARTEVLHKPVPTALGDMKGAVGFQYGFKELSASGEGGELLSPNESKNFAAYIFEEFQTTKKLKLQLAGRIEKVEVDGVAAIFPPGFEFEDYEDDVTEEARSRSFVPFSVSAGALYKLDNDIVARLTGQYVERAPDALELFAKGPHHATETFEIGNPNLTKEKAHSLEFGLKKSKGRFRFDASAYATAFDGFIYKNFTGNTCEGHGCEGEEHHDEDEGDEHEHGLTQIHYDQKDAIFYGTEISASFDLAQVANGTFGIDGQYDYVRAKFRDGTNVPRITPQRLGFGVYYRSSDFFARIGALHAFDQKDVAENETPTEGYTLVNAEMTYNLKLGDGDASSPVMVIGLTGENLLDEDVRNHVSFKKNDVLQPGRNIMLRGKLKLN